MRTVDVMRSMAIAAKPEAEADLRKNDLAGALDKHFPIDSGWRTKPLCEGEKLLHDIIVGRQA